MDMELFSEFQIGMISDYLKLGNEFHVHIMFYSAYRRINSSICRTMNVELFSEFQIGMISDYLKLGNEFRVRIVFYSAYRRINFDMQNNECGTRSKVSNRHD